MAMGWDWVRMEWGGDRTGLAGLGRDGDGMGSRLQGAGVGWDGIGGMVPGIVGLDGVGGDGMGRSGDGMGWDGVRME